MFQNYNLIPALTAVENIVVVRYVGVRDDTLGPKFNEGSRLLGIEDRVHHRPHSLSGGEQQRLAMARVIVNPPAFDLVLQRAKAVRVRRKLGQHSRIL